MKFLAINTAGEAVEAVLYLDGKTVLRRDAQFKKASAVCLPFVDELLQAADLSLEELDFIGICVGPGSFTGIRIGLTIARAFAQFASLPLVPVTAPEVLAYNTECERVVTLSDAANGFIYAAVFEGESRSETIAPFVMKHIELEPFLNSIKKPFCICADSFCQTLISGAAIEQSNGLSLVSAVRAAFEQRGTVPYTQVIPLYVRKSQAEEKFGL